MKRFPTTLFSSTGGAQFTPADKPATPSCKPFILFDISPALRFESLPKLPSSVKPRNYSAWGSANLAQFIILSGGARHAPRLRPHRHAAPSEPDWRILSIFLFFFISVVTRFRTKIPKNSFQVPQKNSNNWNAKLRESPYAHRSFGATREEEEQKDGYQLVIIGGDRLGDE
jgi:hypothetical protein